MELYALKINGLNDPIGYCFDTVTVSWKVKNAAEKSREMPGWKYLNRKISAHCSYAGRGQSFPAWV